MNKNDGPKDPTDDPTGEHEEIDFDPTKTDQLGDDYRATVVAASEDSAGTIEFDARGQPRWKWITEHDAPADPTAQTFNHLKALDNDTLGVADDPPKQAERAPSAKSGYNPYDKPVAPRKPPKPKDR
jgi:hypothetical protein